MATTSAAAAAGAANTTIVTIKTAREIQKLTINSFIFVYGVREAINRIVGKLVAVARASDHVNTGCVCGEASRGLRCDEERRTNERKKPPSDRTN